MATPKKLCIVHAQADTVQVGELAKRLQPLENREDVILWHLACVPAGDSIPKNFQAFFAEADAVLIWISPDLWAEDGLYNLFRQQTNSPRIIPVLARSVVWDSDDFLKKHAKALLPATRQPMPTDDPARQDAWFSAVVDGLTVELGLRVLETSASPEFWKKWPFWAWAIPVLISLAGLFLAYPSYKADTQEIEAREANKDNSKMGSPAPPKDDEKCPLFPSEFDSSKLYILITRFEDYINKSETDCYGKSIETRIDVIKIREKLPIEICYYEDDPPNQSGEAARLRDRFHADVVIWGRIRNASPDCRADGFCLNYQPSDTLISYAGGKVPQKVDNEYLEKGITSIDIEDGLIRLGGESFDAWVISMCNLKIGKKKPEFYRISEDWPVKRKVAELNTRANLFLKLGLFENAITDYGSIIQLDSGGAQSYLQRGMAKIKSKQFEKSILDFNRVLELNPNDIIAYIHRGWARIEMRQFSAAIQDFNHVIKLVPKNIDAYNFRALAKSRTHQFAGAIADIDKAIEISPNNSVTYDFRGVIKFDNKKYSEAILDFSNAIKLNPKFSGAYSNRGIAKYNLSKFEDAILDFNRAIELDPTLSNAYSNRGLANASLGQYDEAFADCNKAITLNPNSSDAYNSRGFVYYRLGQHEEALADYNNSIRLNGNNIRALIDRGGLRYRMGFLNEALLDFDKVIELDTSDAKFYDYRGVVKDELKLYEGAINDYTKALNIDPEFSSPYNNRAVSYRKTGKYFLAIKDWLKSIQLKYLNKLWFYIVLSPLFFAALIYYYRWQALSFFRSIVKTRNN
ncbi:MAG: tetratricopeptide repeat protein [Saprospiraceae bacterium]|nr:tetratricopeptide repeat protein [Saprospiraceae bacterium]